MKLLTFSFVFFLNFNLYSQSKPEALELYRLRGENSENAIKAATIFENLSKEEANKTERCFFLNKASYLNFYHGTQLSNTEMEENFLKKSQEQSDACILLFMNDYDIEIVEKLDDTTKKEIANSLYQGGTSLARYSEIKGTTTAIKNWASIKKRMNFILKMRYAETDYYGAHRTLGIANTKMPSPFGNKEKAYKYLNLAVNNTLMNGRGISQYIFNSISLAEYFFKMRDPQKACSILTEIIQITPEEFKNETPTLYYENLNDQKRAKKLFNEIKC